MLARLAISASLVVALTAPRAAANPAAALVFDAANFTSPVQNQYFPLSPLTVYFYEAQAAEGRYRTEVTVTYNTKAIEGIAAIEVHDVVWLDVANGPTALIEDTLKWYAPDNLGNVWFLGEARVQHLYDEYWNEIGTTTEGSWQAGIDGAQPGLIMPANPGPGMAYRQQLAEGVAEDIARVERANAQVTVPYNTFEHALVIKESTPLEPGSIGRTYYVPGVGLVLVETLHGARTLRQVLVAVAVSSPAP